MTLTTERRLAIGLAAAVLLFQLVNLATGRFWHPYLVPDVALSLLLLDAATTRPDRRAAPYLLACFAAFAGVFLAASCAQSAEGPLRPNTLAAAAGLVVSALAAVRLVGRLRG
jgi:hypothetical protein